MRNTQKYNIAYLSIGILLLIFGLFFYLAFRHSELSSLFEMFGLTNNITLLKQSLNHIDFPFLDNLPSFIHIVAMTFLTLGALGIKGRSIFFVSSFWLIINLMFEFGQYFAEPASRSLNPDSSFFIQIIQNYFFFGIYDNNDVIALLLGFALVNLFNQFHKTKFDRIITPSSIPKKLMAFSIFIQGIGSIMGTSTCGSDKRTCNAAYYNHYEPVYLSYEELRSSISSLQDRALENPGKIYLYQNLLLVNSINKGVFIYNNQEPSNPQFITFVNIPGNLDIAVRDSFLYVDSYIDLVVIDIHDVSNIEITHRIENIFPYDPYQNIPENIYLKNYDPAKGVVVGYKDTTNEIN